jgi:uncharacterized protein YlzI (FlbEa/FlbD family)
MKISRFILLFDLNSNQQYVNPDYIVAIQQTGSTTIVNLTTYNFQTRTDASEIYRSIQSNDLLNQPSIFEKD